ncbi:MAG: hypothetical protein K1X55_12605 [Chitinophagales bacterium]|nr:hypothetical protein [Chitinophagales bacterium]
MEKYYVVKYEGPFGYIKPWTAVRDSETYTQQFLTPSIVEGIEKKLFPELLESKDTNGKVLKIKRYRLNYQGLDMQQERTWSKGGIDIYKDKGQWKTNMGILLRGVMLHPNLYLAFDNKSDADRAMEQTICLCRNEDLVFPMEQFEIEKNGFDTINGFELLTSDAKNGFKVGHNRFDNAAEMFGELKVFGNPIRES